MAGNINGTVNYSMSLDGVSASQPQVPNGSLINKSGPTPLAAAVPFTTWVNSGSNKVATFSGLTGSQFVNSVGSQSGLVAIFWSVGANNYYVTDMAVTSATGTGFTATASNLILPGGSTAQTLLPASNTPILVALQTQVTGLAINGPGLDQILITSTQSGLVELFDNSGTPVIRRTSIISAANGFDGFPSASGQTLSSWTAAGWTTQTVVTANFYNNSLNTAVMQVVALLN